MFFEEETHRMNSHSRQSLSCKKAQVVTGRRNAISGDPDDEMPAVLRRRIKKLDDKFS
jgi:hypothetical protein